MTTPPVPRSAPRPFTLRLADGTRIDVRALVPEDRALLADAFRRMSPRSRYLRFLSPIRELPPRTLDALVTVDHVDHVALLALAGGAAVGVARYVRDGEDPTVADFAITVVDAFQGRGLGRALLLALLDVAGARGVRALTFDVHPDNRAMLGLAGSLGARLTLGEGAVRGRLEVAAAGAGLADAA